MFQYLLHRQGRKWSNALGGSYNVHCTELGWNCSCPDHMYRGVKCKHIYAVEFSFALREQVKKEIIIQPVDSLVKKAIRRNKYGNIQRYLCKECGKRFSFDIGFENEGNTTNHNVGHATILYR